MMQNQLLCLAARLFFFFARRLLHSLTVLRCPQLLRDPTWLMTRLWSGGKVSFDSKNPAVPLGDSESRTGKSLLVIVPFRNRWDLTEAAASSLMRQESLPPRVKLALVDNGSDESCLCSVRAWMHSTRGQLPSAVDIELLHLPGPFNYSRLNNEAIKHSMAAEQFENILFLNNDVKLTDKRTVARMLRISGDPDLLAGAVGCTLLYPDGRVQHSFVAPGVVIVGAHPFKGIVFRKNLAWFQSTWCVPAVTGALLLAKAEPFLTLGGFDERLPTAYQDVDLCLNFERIGLKNYTIGPLTAVHHESATRKDLPAYSETKLMYEKWGRLLTRHPGYPRSLSRWSERPVLSIGEPDFPWQLLYGSTN